MPGQGPLRIGGWVPGPADGHPLTDADGRTPPDSYGPDPYLGPDSYAGPDEYADQSQYQPPLDGSSSWDGAPAEDIVDSQEPDSWDAFAPPAQAAPGRSDPRSQRPRAEPKARRRLVTPRIAIAGVAVGVLLVSAGLSARVLLTDPDNNEAQPPPVPPDGLVASPDADGKRDTPAPTAPGPSEPASEPPASTEVSVEAEAAEVGSHGQVVSVDGASGGDAVRLSGNRKGTFVQFSGIEVDTAGTYRLTIGYLAEQDRTGVVVANDNQGAAQAVTFPSRAEAGTVGEVGVNVQLAAGGNNILVSSTGGAPLFIDGITITPVG